jgi:hypothetical protein
MQRRRRHRRTIPLDAEIEATPANGFHVAKGNVQKPKTESPLPNSSPQKPPGELSPTRKRARLSRQRYAAMRLTLSWI